MYKIDSSISTIISSFPNVRFDGCKGSAHFNTKLKCAQTVDKTLACFPRWGFVLRIKNNKKRLIYAVFWRFCGIMIVTNLK